MADGTMVKETLTEEMIQAGKELMLRLDQSDLAVQAGLWLYLTETNIWRLVIESPAVNTEGPRSVYRKVQSVLPKMQHPTISLSDISVVGHDDPLVSLLRVALKTGRDVAGIRFSRNTINGHFIEDAYIYRLLPSESA